MAQVRETWICGSGIRPLDSLWVATAPAASGPAAFQVETHIIRAYKGLGRSFQKCIQRCVLRV